MSATNTTAIINLPLFIGTDKPSWLVDWNGAMNTIDSAISALQTAESGTATSLASLAQSLQALSGTVEQHTTAIQTVTTATATNTGSINTITSLIGNGLPTTDDKTIIGAINELKADVDELAADVPTVKNDLGAYVDLASYTQANSYVAPEDGYVFVNSGSTNYANAIIYGATSEYTNNVQARAAAVNSVRTMVSTFIRKGMKVYVDIPNDSNGYVHFVPFA